MMKTSLSFIFLLLLVKMNALAQYPPNQPQQDCINAIPVCDSIIYESNSYRGDGPTLAEIDSTLSCLGRGEQNGAWYMIHVLKAGNICFTITPDSSQQDIDFGVFNLTNATCSDIKVDNSLEVACNFITNAGPCNGVTGADGATAGICGFQHLPCIPALEGETYLLYVSSYNLFDGGYTIDFRASTAVLFDNKAIKAKAKLQMPNRNQIEVEFSKPISCAQLSSSKFSFAGISTTYTINQVIADDCSDGSQYDSKVILEVSPPVDLNELGNLELIIADSMVEMCGQSTLTLSTLVGIDFEVKSQPSVDSVCSTDKLSLSTNIPNGSNLQILWEPSSFSGPVFQPNLGISDTFIALVFAANGTLLGQERKEFIVLEGPEVNIGEDTTLCGPDTISLLATGRYQELIWNDNSKDSEIRVSQSGLYWVEARNSNGCIIRDSVKVAVLDLPIPTFSVDGNGSNFDFQADCQECSSFTWEVSDGSTGSGSQWSYTFQDPGQFLVKLIVKNSCGVDSSTQMVRINVSTTEPEVSDLFKVYPNPASKILYVESSHQSEGIIAIHNSLGVEVMKVPIRANGVSRLDVGHLAKGLYFSELSTKDGSFIQKVWIK
ncbi:MAG: PKD domain-containing protein [Bacteroidia bacterium]|nr:PKD domain-containing protein [Bacteroidia bacterium]